MCLRGSPNNGISPRNLTHTLVLAVFILFFVTPQTYDRNTELKTLSPKLHLQLADGDDNNFTTMSQTVVINRYQ